MRGLAQLELNQATAKTLLRDTSYRLQGQSHLLGRIKTSLLQNDNEDDAPRPGIVKAYMNNTNNNLLDWKGHLEREQEQQRVMHQVDKTLRNLEVLHSDTLQLTTQLLESTRLWGVDSFTNAHKSVVAASMEQIRSRHATTLETVADLVLLLKHHGSCLSATVLEDNGDMTLFLRGRLAVQILCDHYVRLDKNKSKNGGISVDCSLAPVIEEAKTEAVALCDAHYQTSPDIVLPTDYPSLTLIRPWLHHALVEVLKNAMVASMEQQQQQQDDSSAAPPPIEIEVIETDSDGVSIQIRDYGAGLPPDYANPFEFASSPQRWDRLDVQQSYASVRSPLSSMGVGVPSSLWLLSHFGGHLSLSNHNDNDGCVATLTLPRDDDLPEYLPSDVMVAVEEKRQELA